ncbi:Flp family type IVb pilin [Phycicoccus sp. M110.8]|uniref:Flp family type IVb pilin n=1 Tax=Phycicoccus sp. M110.8 TaxID=3075433 RepID=UPI0028FD214A|nr:Flp family type IVb pilin [Phycicoccus sp. M110.8]MDU0312663.1 Flp family type IVb pilin [Phycicoccus sp. M110.8]
MSKSIRTAHVVRDVRGTGTSLQPLPLRGLRGRLGTRRGDHGATAVEYAIMASLIAVVIVGSVTIFGQNLIQLFQVPASAL